VTSRLDDCNALGVCPALLINKLQLVQNAAAPVLTRTRKKDHILAIFIVIGLIKKFGQNIKASYIMYYFLPLRLFRCALFSMMIMKYDWNHFIKGKYSSARHLGYIRTS